MLGDVPILPKIAESGDSGKPLSNDDTSEVFMIYDEIAEKTVNVLNKIKIKDVDISS